MAREKIFRFKQFEVLNERTAMKVGTDGVLLGAWCPVESAHQVLDVGTGCGVIALMIAQRNNDSVIQGIDIDLNAIEEASTNFANSPWSDRLTARECDFNDMLDKTVKFDLIVSNPPFFSDSLLPPDVARTVARHTQTLTYPQLIEGSVRLLTENGTLAFISPTEAEAGIIEAATFASLPVRHITRVISKEGSAPKRTLWMLSRRETEYLEDTLTISRAEGPFTEEYVALTRDFYLKM